MSHRVSEREQVLIGAAIARLQAGIMAIVCGLLTGTGLLVATIWLVSRGGPNMGQHLSLLGSYLPGYTVSWAGAILGFVYGAVVGGAVGWSAAWIYNRIVKSALPS